MPNRFGERRSNYGLWHAGTKHVQIEIDSARDQPLERSGKDMGALPRNPCSGEQQSFRFGVGAIWRGLAEDGIRSGNDASNPGCIDVEAVAQKLLILRIQADDVIGHLERDS